MDHPVLNAIRRESFTALGWFAPNEDDRVPAGTQFDMALVVGDAAGNADAASVSARVQ